MALGDAVTVLLAVALIELFYFPQRAQFRLFFRIEILASSYFPKSNTFCVLR